MQLSQSIRLKQKQSMVMTPRLQQAIRMLQMNNLDLASYLEDQALENPFLEVAANSAEGEETGGNDAFDAAAPDTAQAAAAGTIDTDMKAGASPQDDPAGQQPARRGRESGPEVQGGLRPQGAAPGDSEPDLRAARRGEKPAVHAGRAQHVPLAARA